MDVIRRFIAHPCYELVVTRMAEDLDPQLGYFAGLTVDSSDELVLDFFRLVVDIGSGVFSEWVVDVRKRWKLLMDVMVKPADWELYYDLIALLEAYEEQTAGRLEAVAQEIARSNITVPTTDNTSDGRGIGRSEPLDQQALDGKERDRAH